ncbi:uncharacterized protein BKA78DRAFT_352670 [Phyllosticta capitalensis]|uniref:uncharacterized protein n=1 Tax=Phyllosticta capitalensis TaxID=121624 RepID=UPI003131FF97
MAQKRKRNGGEPAAKPSKKTKNSQKATAAVEPASVARDTEVRYSHTTYQDEGFSYPEPTTWEESFSSYHYAYYLPTKKAAEPESARSKGIEPTAQEEEEEEEEEEEKEEAKESVDHQSPTVRQYHFEEIQAMSKAGRDEFVFTYPEPTSWESSYSYDFRDVLRHAADDSQSVAVKGDSPAPISEDQNDVKDCPMRSESAAIRQYSHQDLKKMVELGITEWIDLHLPSTKRPGKEPQQ